MKVNKVFSNRFLTLLQENTQLKRDLISIQLQEHQGKQNTEEEAEKQRKIEAKTKKKNHKEEWELRVLSIGMCRKCKTEGLVTSTNSRVSRPMSASETAVRPASARPKRPSSKLKRPTTALLQRREQTLSPGFLKHLPEGRKAKKLIAEKQEKIILSSPRTSSASSMKRSPSQNSMISSSLRKSPSQSSMTYSHMSRESTLPYIPRKQNNDKTKVFVWTDDNDVTKVGNQRSAERSGEEDGDQTLVVGDHVIVSMNSTCPKHRYWSTQEHGIIKFMGFVFGNSDNMYLGVRLENDGVGVSDGFIEGRRYFKCESERGVFVRLRDVAQVIPQEQVQDEGEGNESELDSDDSEVQHARILQKYSIKTQ